jgi:uncharacterized metal-binding protein YceD (DUF177 family)
MREHRSEKYSATPWHVPIAVDDVAETGGRFELVADAEVRAAVARLAELRDVPRLQASFEVRRAGAAGLRVTGRVSATVGQNCVVTLEALSTEVEEEVDLLFEPRATAEPGDGEAGARDEHWHRAESLVDGRIDLGALATEFLVLGLDPYPRKPGAVFQPPQDAAPEEGPFAALESLKKERDGR